MQIRKSTGLTYEEAQKLANYLNQEYDPFIYKQTRYSWSVHYLSSGQASRFGFTSQDLIVVYQKLKTTENITRSDGVAAHLLQDCQTTMEFFEKNFKGSYWLHSDSGICFLKDEKLLHDLKHKALAYSPVSAPVVELKSVDLAQLEIDLHKVTSQLAQSQDAKTELEQYQYVTQILLKIKSKKELTLGECREISAYCEKLKKSNVSSQVKTQLCHLVNSLLKRPLPIPDFKQEDSIKVRDSIPDLKQKDSIKVEEGEPRKKTIAEQIDELKLTEKETALFEELINKIKQDRIKQIAAEPRLFSAPPVGPATHHAEAKLAMS